MEAIEAIRTRRSVRDFKSDPVPREVIEEIIDCGRLATTARNDQPWEFVVVTEPEMRKKIAEAAEYGKFIATAPVCVLVICRETKYYLEDGCNAAENILIAARAHGLGSCWVAGDKKPYAETLLRMVGAPKGMKLICEIAIGYPKSVPQPPKRALGEVLHWERY